MSALLLLLHAYIISPRNNVTALFTSSLRSAFGVQIPSAIRQDN